MMTWSKVTSSVPPPLSSTEKVCGSVKVAQPSISVILFFFIR